MVRAIKDALPAAKGWAIDATLLNRPQERYTYLGVRRSTWDAGLHVGISAEKGGPADWIIGVWGDQGYQHVDLTTLLIERWGSGLSSDIWPWYHWFEDHREFGARELGDWRTGAAVIALYEGAAGDYGKRLCERIVSIAKAVDGLFATPAAGG